MQIPSGTGSDQDVNSTIGRIARFCLHRRQTLFVIAVFGSVLLAGGMIRLSYDSSLDSLLTRSDPWLDELELLEQQFPVSTEVVFAFIASEGESIFTASSLRTIDELRSRYREIPLAARHSSLLDYYSPRSFRRLFARDYREYGDDELADLAQTAITDDLLTGNLLVADTSIAFTRIRLNADRATETQRLDAAEAALGIRDELRESNPGLTIHVTSEVLFEYSTRQAILEDLAGLLPFVLLACILAICWCFRSVRAGLAILTHTLLTLLCTLGVLGLAGFSFNTVTAVAPVIVVVVSVANGVHVISLYRQGLQRRMSEPDAMMYSLMQNIRPVSLTALTTAIGFAALNLSSSPAIRGFGSTVAIGIVFAWLLSAALLPTLLTRLMHSAPQGGNDLLKRCMEQVVSLGHGRDRLLFWFFSVFSVAGLAMLPLNETDFNRLDFISDAADLREYFETLGDRINRGPSISYGVDTGVVSGAVDPDFLAGLESLLDWLVAQDDVESTASVVEVLKTVNQMRYGGDDTYLLPRDSVDINNYLNAYQAVQNQDFPLSRFLNQGNSIAAMTVNARPMSNQALLDLNARIDAKFPEFLPSATLVHGSGLLIFARMDERVTVELLQGYSLSLALITITLMFGLGSLYFGILSIIPNLLPAAIVFGFWGLLVGTLDPFVMMLFSISIGLVVDDTVHILTHYLEKRRAGGEIAPAIAYSIRTAGPALTITTLVLTLGTTFLIAASTIYFQQAARLLVPIVVLALVLDLLYLPAILKRLDRSGIPVIRSQYLGGE